MLQMSSPFHNQNYQSKGELTMKKLSIFIGLVLVTFLLLPTTSKAIPAFAKKYGFNCNMCHTGFTKLNDFGQRYRDNGYQIPGQEGGEKNIFDLAPPLALRTTTGLTVYKTTEGTTTGFNIFGLDLLAAGVLHKNVSFMMIYTPRIDEPANNYLGLTDSSKPSQYATLESANLVFSNLIQDVLNIRVGRFEPAYHPFSSKRKYYIFEPYEIYTFTTPGNSFSFDDNQIGIEATGHLRSGFKYGLGVVNGNGGSPDMNRMKDFYLNLSHTFGKGDGQSAGQRVGAFGYIGWQPTSSGTFVAPTGETNGKDNKTFYRIGLDGSFNFETFNLGLLFMKGVDDKALNILDPTKNYDYSGGFAQLDWAGLMNNRLVASLMYNWVQPPSYDAERKINAYSALVRYYLGDWSAVNIAIHGEYTFKRTGKDHPLDENLFSLILDFDF
jgi:hypothetical protein